MSKSIFILGFALVMLGFLVSITLNMHSDMEMLRAENKTMTENLTQLSSTYKIITQERDNLRNQNTELLKKIEILQQAYVVENQARRKAESDLAGLQATLANMMKGTQILSQIVDSKAGPRSNQSKRVSLVTIIPFSTGFVTLLAILSLGKKTINLYRAYKSLNRAMLQTRSFPQSIPRIKSSNM